MSEVSQYDTIISKLDDTYSNGRANGNLLFFGSSVMIHSDGGIDATHKPQVSKPEVRSNAGPFSPPYVPGLYVDELKEENEDYVVLMNKYCVVQNHFLLVTKEFKRQTSPLTPCDLAAAYKLMSAGRRHGKNFFMFYNCGPLSGSSQPHKHLQFMPIPEEEVPPIEKLAQRQRLEVDGKAFIIPSLPYAHHVFRLPAYRSRPLAEILDTLTQAFISLLDLTFQTMRQLPTLPDGPPAYNVLLTFDHLHVIPRGRAEHMLSRGGIDVPVNALGFAGMLMTKSEEDQGLLIEEGPLAILRGVGLPIAEGESCSAVESSILDD
ncbi:bifunctional AP-4-A phosphorylase/ADP sulfurylase [Tulasnella sp. 424]|nr:bifunctional AP-4-A phosphorylase/ADP sulfurylase [Tulasnella sp. 424]KAG8980497.1 bifunctional AP-4-A phosphorylase/ADP sulfurylase [Tulasnella sp. 425]